MEAVPKLPLLSFELKVSPENTHFGPKLKQYIAEAYGEDPESYSNEIHQLEGLRSAAVRPTTDSAGLSALIRYFCQLRAMQSRFPMSKGQPAACSFSWKDLYANMNRSLPDIRFEMACILYNIGALHTQLGASEPRTTADSLKSTCTHYQNAAWAFQYLKEQYPQPSGADVSTDIMRLFQEICFAQAQECILDKSIQDTRKPSVVGAVATQVLFFYKNSLALLGPSTGTDNIHEVIGTKLYNYWHRYLSFKAFYIGCIVCLYQGINAEEQQKMGERVAFYQQAVEKLCEARKLAKYIEPTQVTLEALTFTNDVVEGKRKAAKNENEFIYHEEVPDKDLLMDMKPVCLVKGIPINFNDPEIAGQDVFSRLVPMVAHEASSMYSEEKAKLLRQVVGRAEAKDTELMEFMSSLQLDQLEVLDSDQKVPQDIVDRCAAMNAKAEVIQTLVDSMNNLAEVISDVEHSLSEIKSIIQEETLKEKEYQKVMGPRPPSIVQTELSREYHKYQEAHTRTNESNQVLHKAMTLHIANLRLLAQPLDVLHSKIPSIDNIEGLDRETMKEMRRVVGKAREMQTQRTTLIQQLRDSVAADDITSQLLSRSSEPTDEIFKQELEKHNPQVKIIEQNLTAQENIINKLTSLYAAYGESRRLLSDVLRKRDGLINALVTSYDTYEELLGKSQKGQEFYKKLSHNVNQLLTRLRSTCQVQEEERQQLLAKQTSKPATPTPTVVSQRSTPEPSLPSTPSTGPPRKLKDYLPYMKNRNLRGVTPQDPMPSDTYYPESIYPTSVRPTPVGSEDITQMQLPDGVVMPPMQNMHNPYDRYSVPYASETDPYNPNYAYPASSKALEKPDENYGYTTPYTPPQFSSNMPDQQIYTNPYYSATQNNSTVVTDSPNSIPHNTSTGQANMNQNTYNYSDYPNQMGVTSDVRSLEYNTASAIQADLNASLAQMQVSVKPDSANFGTDYSAYYSVNYPHTSTPNLATYSNAPQSAATSMVPSQIPADYSSLNYPYSTDPSQYGQQVNTGQQINAGHQYNYGNAPQNYSSTPQSYANTSQTYANTSQSFASTPQSCTNLSQSSATMTQNYPNTPQSVDSTSQVYANTSQGYINTSQGYNNISQSYVNMSQNYANTSQSYAAYTNADTGITLTTSVSSTVSSVTAQPYALTTEHGSNFLSQLDALDKPIKSHVTGEALSSNVSFIPNYQYDVNTQANYPNAMGQHYQNTEQGHHTVKQSFPTEQPAEQNYQINQQMNQPTSMHSFNDMNPNQGQTYQNHPGYTLNAATGNYEYNYGSQNTYTSDNANLNNQGAGKDQNWSVHGVYTNAGGCDTVQSPSEVPAMPHNPTGSNDQIYYNVPYGYLTANNQANEVNMSFPAVSTNYGANVNESTYMQSGPEHDTSVTYSNNQVSSPKEDVCPPNFDQNVGHANNQNNSMSNVDTNNVYANQNMAPNNFSENSISNVQNIGYEVQTVNQNNDRNLSETTNLPGSQNIGYATHNTISTNDNTGYATNNLSSNNDQNSAYTAQNSAPTDNLNTGITANNDQNAEVTNENIASQNFKHHIIERTQHDSQEKPEPSVFDLLSDIDFTVEAKPLMPEIKVPQISESVIKRQSFVPKVEPIVKPKEEVIERPAKMDLFSDPGLLNKFTQEVKKLQKLMDSLTTKTPSGLTVLDSKWKNFQDVQAKENMSRSKTFAMKYSEGNIVAEVVPFDDSRVTLKSDPDAYINASYYKQLASWCIPLIISKNPSEQEYSVFWKAVLENKVSSIVCLLSEIEMQGISYWPTAKGQCLDLPGKLKVILDEVNCTVHWTERKITVACGKTVLNVTHYQINVFPAKIVCSPLVLLADKILSQTYDNRLSNQLSSAWVQCGAGAGRSSVLSLLIMLMCQVRAGQLDLCNILDTGCINLYKHRTNVLEDTKYLVDAYRTALFYVQGVLCSGTTMFNGEAVLVPSGASVLPPVTPTPPSAPAQKPQKFSRESFEEMKQSPGLKSGDMKDPLNFLDPLWSLKKK